MDIKKISADLGVILGVMLFVLNTILYILDIELFLNPMVGLITFILIIGFGIYSILNSRKKLGGYINWSDSLLSYMACVAVGMSISTLSQIFIFIILDPTAAEKLNEMSMIMVKEMYTGMNLPEEVIQQALIEVEKNPSFSFKNISISFAMAIVIQVIIGSLSALIFKRSNPEIA
tara:strand:- start:249 stop:773 length:525 start_codon:yes stop_codon:yes gene_type:complete